MFDSRIHAGYLVPSLGDMAFCMMFWCVEIKVRCIVQRIKELQADEASKKLLRLSIEAGGCSGFQYNFSLDDKTNHDDRLSTFFAFDCVLW